MYPPFSDTPKHHKLLVKYTIISYMPMTTPPDFLRILAGASWTSASASSFAMVPQGQREKQRYQTEIIRESKIGIFYGYFRNTGFFLWFFVYCQRARIVDVYNDLEAKHIILVDFRAPAGQPSPAGHQMRHGATKSCSCRSSWSIANKVGSFRIF